MFGTLSDFGGSLFDEFRRMEREMDALFGGGPWPAGIRSVRYGAFPPINVGATKDNVEVYLFAPGLDPKSVDLSIQQNLLTVSGERKTPEHEATNYYRQERFTGDFHRVIALPDDVDADRVQAQYRDGVLHITVHRKESAKPRQIEVNLA